MPHAARHVSSPTCQLPRAPVHAQVSQPQNVSRLTGRPSAAVQGITDCRPRNVVSWLPPLKVRGKGQRVALRGNGSRPDGPLVIKVNRLKTKP